MPVIMNQSESPRVEDLINPDQRTNEELLRDVSGNIPTMPVPPPLLMNPNQNKGRFWIGVIFAIFDLCIMPIVYFYAIRYGTGLSLQDIFAIITGIFGLFCFIHYTFRSLRLFLSKKLVIYGPIGWTKWGLFEFLHVNVAIIIFLIEVVLIVGTAPSDPIIRLCSMTSATASYYLGFLCLFSSILTFLHWPLPFNMSSTPKGSPWRPALYAFIEDFGAIEMSGEKAFRLQLARRYETSGQFRRMIDILSWCWGIGFLSTAIATTVVVLLIPENVVFGIGWGMPYICSAIMAVVTVVFVKWSLRNEKRTWRSTI